MGLNGHTFSRFRLFAGKGEGQGASPTPFWGVGFRVGASGFLGN
jgi:hypothetical protein